MKRLRNAKLRVHYRLLIPRKQREEVLYQLLQRRQVSYLVASKARPDQGPRRGPVRAVGVEDALA
ncbi:hypothetical protein GB937_002358 [Aspergillus fischeri]|nr:hypothetical protein GB937_002358 [Aspergillus fischeri]